MTLPYFVASFFHLASRNLAMSADQIAVISAFSPTPLSKEHFILSFHDPQSLFFALAEFSVIYMFVRDPFQP